MMTNEEAIRILSTRDAHGVLCGYTSGVTEALDMAIEALQIDIVHCYECKYDDSCCQCVDIIDDLLSLNFCSCGKRKEVEE